MKPKLLPLLLVTALLAGELTGCILYLRFPVRRLFAVPFVLHGIGKLGGSLPALLPELLGYPMLWLALLCLPGLTVCAVPMAFSLVFLHGVTIGAVLTRLCQGHVITGILKTGLFVMPYAAVQTILFLLAARESVRSSLSLTHTLQGRAGERFSLRLFGVRFLVLAAGIALSGILQAVWGGICYPLVLHWLSRLG